MSHSVFQRVSSWWNTYAPTEGVFFLHYSFLYIWGSLFSLVHLYLMSHSFIHEQLLSITKIECLNLTGTDVPPTVFNNVGGFISFLAGISCPRASIK